MILTHLRSLTITDAGGERLEAKLATASITLKSPVLVLVVRLHCG